MHTTELSVWGIAIGVKRVDSSCSAYRAFYKCIYRLWHNILGLRYSTMQPPQENLPYKGRNVASYTNSIRFEVYTYEIIVPHVCTKRVSLHCGDVNYHFYEDTYINIVYQ